MREPRAWNYRELVGRRNGGRILGWLALTALVVLIMVILRFLSLPSSVLVTMSAGNTEGTVHQFLLSLAQDAAGGHLRIDPIITGGSLDNLGRVDSGTLDFAIVQGSYDMDRYHNIRQVAVLSVGPVHLLVKQAYHATVTADLQNLRGRSINLGSSQRAVNYLLSQGILSFAGLAPGDYVSREMTPEEIASETDLDRLPDAIFISTMVPSEMVRQLVVRSGYRLVPLPFGDAFRLTALQGVARPANQPVIRKEHIVDATIPAYAYQASPPVPPRTVSTLGCRVLLIANRRTDRVKVAELLDLMIASRYAEAMQPSLDAGIVRQHAELPWHPGALDYRRRDEPLVTGERIGVLSSALQIMLPATGALLLFWGWLRNRVLTRRELRFDRFIALVSGVERRGLELDQSGARDRQAVRRLHQELCTIKDAALERVAAGEASNSALVTTFFSHISDVRTFLGELERLWNKDRSAARPPDKPKGQDP